MGGTICATGTVPVTLPYSATHRPPEGISGHRAGWEALTQRDSFVRTWEGQCVKMERRRERYVEG